MSRTHHLLPPRIAVLDLCDSHSGHGDGRAFAIRLAERLGASRRYRVIQRSEWQKLLPRGDLPGEYRFHLAWAVHLARLCGADAVVIGKLVQVGVREPVASTALLDGGTGEILARTDAALLASVADALCSERVAGRVRWRARSLQAVISCTMGGTVVLDAGEFSGIQPADRFRVERILEYVADPCNPARPAALGFLAAAIGEAEVLDVGRHASLARYHGRWVARAGDLAILL